MPRPLRVALFAASCALIVIGAVLLSLDMVDEEISWISIAGFGLMIVGSLGVLALLIYSRLIPTSRLFTLGYSAGLHDANYNNGSQLRPENPRRAHLRGL